MRLYNGLYDDIDVCTIKCMRLYQKPLCFLALLLSRSRYQEYAQFRRKFLEPLPTMFINTLVFVHHVKSHEHPRLAKGLGIPNHTFFLY